MPYPNILFCGDPHGEFGHIVEQAVQTRPDAIVLLGDLNLPGPLHEVMKTPLDIGVKVLWIPGNHDTDKPEYYDRLFHSEPHQNLYCLHENVLQIQSARGPNAIRIAGLGGVFRTKAWDPRAAPKECQPPGAGTRQHHLDTGGKGNRWRGGLPLRHRSTIFKDQVQMLSEQQADILVTHEAPHHHHNGFEILHRLAQRMGATFSFHGHQHQNLDYGVRDGVRARGVGIRSIMNLGGEVIVDGTKTNGKRPHEAGE